jgi:hypothetical protein
MNDPEIAAIPPTDEEIPVTEHPRPATLTDQVEGLIRRYPVMAALATVGFGCAVGVAARALLTPAPTPKNRALQLLEDIQNRLTEFAEPAYERATDLADEGRHAVKQGLHSLTESRLGNRLRHLFS